MSKVDFCIPDDSEPSQHRQTLAQLAPDLQDLWTGESSAVVDSLFEGLQFPRLTKFSYYGCAKLVGVEKILAQLTQLAKLKVWTSAQTVEQDAEFFTALIQVPWWNQITHLELWFAYRALQPEQISRWADLWIGQQLSLDHLNFHGATQDSVALLLQASFPHLTYLRLSPALTDAVLPLILEAELPALEILDLRFNFISGEALQHFAQSAQERLPRLRQVGVEMYTGERVEYYDWNGAVVDGYDVTLSAEEITDRYLKGTKLSVMSNAPSW